MNETARPYASRNLWETIEKALRATGVNPMELQPGDIAPLDHFHTGGLRASESLFDLASIQDSENLLDIGGGIGGACRFLAPRIDASITCLDLSLEFCSVNQKLTAATGLTERIGIVAGDATSLPFRTAYFDTVWMQQAAMNIVDKDTLYAEIARVLRPGGLYVFQEIVSGHDPGPLNLPVPWASAEEDSHLESADSMRNRLQNAGLREYLLEDVTSGLVPGMVERVKAIEANGPPVLGAHLLSTGDTLGIYRGIAISTQLGRIAFVRGVYGAAS